MSFLFPSFLFALFAIGIPIIIHLFQFRRYKKLYFSNIRFLSLLQEETQKQSRLKHLLILLLRILAIVFLVMAFARPYIPADTSQQIAQGSRISIFIDNSFSMEAGSVAGTLLDQARNTARELAFMFSPTDEYQLLTNDFEARHQRFVSRDEFLAMLDEVTFSPASRPIGEVMQRQSDLLEQEGSSSRRTSFVLSDFQKSIVDSAVFPEDTITDFFIVPFQVQNASNVFVDSLWIDNPVRLPGQIITVEARIYNDSDQRIENQPVRLFVNGVQRAVATFSASARSHTNVILNYTLGNEPFQSGHVEISDHPVIFDNRYYFSFTVSENIPVLAINQNAPNRFLNALIGNDTAFIYRNVSLAAIDFSAFASQNLIILNEIESVSTGLINELVNYVAEGGNLLIFPSGSAELSSYNQLLQRLGAPLISHFDTLETRVTSINELHSIYEGVFERLPDNLDLPVVQQYFVLDRSSRGREQFLLQLQNGNYFFTEVSSGRGRVYLSAVPANDDFSNFPRHAIFVPTIYNIALHSSVFYPLSYTIGQNATVTIRNYRPDAGNLFRIRGEALEVIPETRNINNNIMLLLHGQIQESGIYQLMEEEMMIRDIAFNYDRVESLLETYTMRELEDILPSEGSLRYNFIEPDGVSIDKQMERLMGGAQLWRWFLLAGLLFLFAEGLLIRFMKQ